MKQRWLIWLFVLAAFDAQAQNDVRRTTVGVALEGGGAKGLAHIGVLRWFEEHHIPIDYIAGTSMGGLVAGLYATGYSPAEIEKIISGIDWDQVLAGQTRYEDLSFRRKEDLRALPNYLELGLRYGISLPGGLNSGQAVSLIIDKYLLPYSAPKSFDDLPTPFRCVAADLVTGKQEVFASGSISNALRATMSIPGVFAPVRAGTKILADGGLLNNLPTDVLKKMGPDVAIGVHLSVGPTDPSKLRTLLGVAGGSTGVMIDANVLHGMELSDILLTIDVAGFTTMQFASSAGIIPKGYEAAQAREALLDRLRLSDEDWSRYMARRESRKVAIVAKANFVEVQGASANLSRDIEKKLSGYVGQPIDTKKLEQDIGELQGEGRFDSISYSLAQRNGETGLLITAQEKTYAPPFLKPGFTVDGADTDNVGFTFAARLTFLDVGGYRSELRTDFAFGSRYGLGVEYYHPFTPKTRWFIAPQFVAARTPLNLYSKSTLLAEYRENTVNGGIDIGYGFDRFSELRIGYSAGYLDATKRIGSALLPSVSGRTGATRVRYALDHFDNPVIPRRGVALLSEGKWVDTNPGATTGFPLATTTISGFVPISKPSSVYAVAEGGTLFGHSQTGLPAFALGSPSRLAAYGLDEILTNQYYYFRLGYLHQLASLPAFLGGGLYLDAHYELAKPFGGPGASRLPNDGVLGLVVQTIFGPMTIGGSVGDRGHQKWFFQLGRIY
jgi:NTE family protein